MGVCEPALGPARLAYGRTLIVRTLPEQALDPTWTPLSWRSPFACLSACPPLTRPGPNSISSIQDNTQSSGEPPSPTPLATPVRSLN